MTSDDRFTTEYHKETCTLTIENITIDDEGYYKCEARNEHGTATTVVELFVQSKPQAAWVENTSFMKHVSIINFRFCLGQFDWLIQISEAEFINWHAPMVVEIVCS